MCHKNDNDDHYNKKLMPLGPGYVATAMQRCGIDVSITDCSIYSYDDMMEKYYYNADLSNSINFNNIIHYFYFDSNTDMYWMIDEESLENLIASRKMQHPKVPIATPTAADVAKKDILYTVIT